MGNGPWSCKESDTTEATEHTRVCTQKEMNPRDFPGGQVVKTFLSNEGSADLIFDWGAKIPHASQPKIQNMKTIDYNKFNKDF